MTDLGHSHRSPFIMVAYQSLCYCAAVVVLALTLGVDQVLASKDAFECNVPKDHQITNFAWNRTGEDKSGPFFPMSSASNDAIEKAMVGGGNATNCVRMKWSDEDITVLQFYADPEKPTYFSCEQINPPKNAWNCKHLRAKDDPIDLSHTAYVTLTDNHSYSFTVRCFPGIQAQGWTVFTTKSELCAKKTRKIMRHAQKLGFSVGAEDLVTRDYSTCPAVCLP